MDKDIKAVGDALIADMERAMYDLLVREYGKEAVDRKLAERAARNARRN